MQEPRDAIHLDHKLDIALLHQRTHRDLKLIVPFDPRATRLRATTAAQEAAANTQKSTVDQIGAVVVRKFGQGLDLLAEDLNGVSWAQSFGFWRRVCVRNSVELLDEGNFLHEQGVAGHEELGAF